MNNADPPRKLGVLRHHVNILSRHVVTTQPASSRYTVYIEEEDLDTQISSTVQTTEPWILKICVGSLYNVVEHFLSASASA